MWPELQTMRMTYQQITKGERPWNALGDFLNYWFGYAPHRREELVQDPIQEPEGAAPDLHQWAVFCAASVEYLCQRSGLPCPDWVTAPTYNRLSEPWFTGLGAHKQEVQARLLQETPELLAGATFIAAIGCLPTSTNSPNTRAASLPPRLRRHLSSLQNQLSRTG